jgi:glycine/D-amino acid oxidase-like deaminating enzyme
LNCEVVILGGGITGAINAFILTEAGIPCVLIEKRSIGLGSTIASTALLQYQIDTPLSKLIELRGEAHAKAAYLLCAETINTLAKISKNLIKRPFTHFQQGTFVFLFESHTSHQCLCSIHREKSVKWMRLAMSDMFFYRLRA